MTIKWIRTCQECGNIQQAIRPVQSMSDAYANAKCRKCKSEALDWGKWQDDIRHEDDDE